MTNLTDMTWAERRARYDALKKEYDRETARIDAEYARAKAELLARRTALNAEFTSLSDVCQHPAADRRRTSAHTSMCGFCGYEFRDADMETPTEGAAQPCQHPEDQVYIGAACYPVCRACNSELSEEDAKAWMERAR